MNAATADDVISNRCTGDASCGGKAANVYCDIVLMRIRFRRQLWMGGLNFSPQFFGITAVRSPPTKGSSNLLWAWTIHRGSRSVCRYSVLLLIRTRRDSNHGVGLFDRNLRKRMLSD